jgi:cell division protein FtsW (lipid II flippase)
MDFFLKLFPFLHLTILIAGIIVLLIAKRKYRSLRNSDIIIIFILLCILVALFTEPAFDLVKRFINFIQV